jgi:hypothetical protein
MCPRGSLRKRLPVAVYSGLGLIGATWFGCGGSSERTEELTEEARRTVFQKKVDVKNRSPVSSRSVRSSSKGLGGRP